MRREPEPDADALADPPLPDGPAATAWREYLTCGAQRRRADTKRTRAAFLDAFAQLPEPAREAFAAWACELVFDHSGLWAGQHGGALSPRDGTFRTGRYYLPAVPLLTAHPVNSRVLQPYLLAALPDVRGRRARWLYQFVVGQGYRLPPAERDRLFAVVERHFGSQWPPRELLAMAGSDPVTARMFPLDIEDS